MNDKLSSTQHRNTAFMLKVIVVNCACYFALDCATGISHWSLIMILAGGFSSLAIIMTFKALAGSSNERFVSAAHDVVLLLLSPVIVLFMIVCLHPNLFLKTHYHLSLFTALSIQLAPPAIALLRVVCAR